MSYLASVQNNSNHGSGAAFARQSRLSAIPPRIRAFVKVIHDIDRDQFPDVFTTTTTTSFAAGDDSTNHQQSTQQTATQQRTVLNESAVHYLSKAIGREIRTQQDWDHFSLALEDYARHLTSVDLATLERSGLGRLVNMSTTIDRESMHTHLSMSRDLSAVYGCHQLILKIVQTEFVSRQPEIMALFIGKIADTLEEIVGIIAELVKQQRSAASAARKRRIQNIIASQSNTPAQSFEGTASSMMMSGGREFDASGTFNNTGTHFGSTIGGGGGAVGFDDSPLMGATTFNGSGGDVPSSSPVAVVETDAAIAFRIVQLNSMLEFHVKHLTWFMSASNVNHNPQASSASAASSPLVKGAGSGGEVYGHNSSSSGRPSTFGSGGDAVAADDAILDYFTINNANSPIPFDAKEYINDVSALEVWCLHVGRYTPACSVQQFLPALVAAFPAWAHEPILKVLDYQQCGIISAYSMMRVLSLWGPFLLIDRNLSKDLTRGFINLSDTTAMAETRLRQKLSAGVPTAAAADGSTPPSPLPLLASTSTTSSHQHQPRPPPARAPQALPAGTTVMTVSDDKSYAFDLLLVTAKGNIRRLVVDRSSGSWILQGVSQEDYECPTDACVAFPHIFSNPLGERYNVPEMATIEAANSDAYSILHRACFRNNTAYVAKLIDRGNGMIVDSAIVDPAITSKLSWTPLIAAVNNPNGDPATVCRLLLENGADPLYQDEATCTAFYYAIVNRYVKAATVIIQFYFNKSCNNNNNNNNNSGGVVRGGRSYTSASFGPSLRRRVNHQSLSMMGGGGGGNISGNYANATRQQRRSTMTLMPNIPPPTTSAVTIPLFVGLGAHFYNASDLDNIRLEDCLPDMEVMRMLLSITNDIAVTRAAYNILYHKLRGCEVPVVGDVLGRRRGEGAAATCANTVYAYGTLENRQLTKEGGGNNNPAFLCSSWPALPRAGRGNGKKYSADDAAAQHAANSDEVGDSPTTQGSPLSVASPSSPTPTPAPAPSSECWNIGGFPCPTLTNDEIQREVIAVRNHTALCQAHRPACEAVLRAIGDHCYLLSARRLLAEVRGEEVETML